MKEASVGKASSCFAFFALNKNETVSCSTPASMSWVERLDVDFENPRENRDLRQFLLDIRSDHELCLLAPPSWEMRTLKLIERFIYVIHELYKFMTYCCLENFSTCWCCSHITRVCTIVENNKDLLSNWHSNRTRFQLGKSTFVSTPWVKSKPSSAREITH